jgi:hemerythrin-like domain-containing protein
MKFRGPLMIEHRLIEKVLKAAARKAATITEHNYDPVLIDTVVDFIKTYTDRTHHGKEEDILFAELSEKKIGEDDVRVMNELIGEHVQARAKVEEIVGLNALYKKGNTAVAVRIRDLVGWLMAFYTTHIRKEEEVFFPAAEKYFTVDELDAMVLAFNEFDRRMIHEKYEKAYESINGWTSSQKNEHGESANDDDSDPDRD